MTKDPVADVSLVLFLKAPHNAKRRLAAEIGKSATAVARLLCECALQDMEDWQGPAWFSPAEPDDEAWLDSRLSSTARIMPQRGANLGERINYVDAQVRSTGPTKIIFIGSDCPGLDSEYLGEAAAHLDEYDAVVGPSRDGGVVLMGARRAWPELRDLRWSTSHLLEDLCSACERSGWTIARLEVRSDIDNLSDLLTVRNELLNDTRRTRRDLTEWLTSQADTLQTEDGEGTQKKT